MKKLFLILTLTITQISAYSQSDKLSPAIIRQLKSEQIRMFDLFSKGDVETFKKIAGDDYLSINADGTSLNKTQALELIPNFKGSTYKVSDQTDRVYGNVIISTGRAKFYLSSILVAEIYFNQTWVYRDNRWQFIFWQGTMTGIPKYYPIYVTLIGSIIILRLIILILRFVRKQR
jgi:hypothetical protein